MIEFMDHWFRPADIRYVSPIDTSSRFHGGNCVVLLEDGTKVTVSGGNTETLETARQAFINELREFHKPANPNRNHYEPDAEKIRGLFKGKGMSE